MWKSVYDNATFVLGPYQRRAAAQAKMPQSGSADKWTAEMTAADQVLAILRRLSGTPEVETVIHAAGTGQPG